MELLCKNIEPFKGNHIAPPLKLETNYTLKSYYICGCDEKHYDVGVTSECGSVECYKCRELLPNSGNIHWCHSSRFVEV